MKKYIALALIIASSCSKDGAIDMRPVAVNGEILFISRRIPNSADWQLVLMNADGTDQKIISDKLVTCAPPVFSTTGAKIAFTTYEDGLYNLYSIDRNGGNLKLLSQSAQYCGEAAWSPDDSRIAFVKTNGSGDGRYDIYSVKTDGSDEIKLTSQNHNSSPQYSPHTNTIVFSSIDITGSESGVYQMNSDGSDKKLLTPAGQRFGSPRISPDGRLISIISGDWNGTQLFVMNADGNNLKQLTFTVSPDYFDTGFPRPGNSDPVWSPNSDKIAYVSYENGSPDIFVINPDGTGNKRLTDTPLRDENPAWTKDGNYILFSSNRKLDASAEIYIMRAGGQLQSALTNYTGDDIYPSFITK